MSNENKKTKVVCKKRGFIQGGICGLIIVSSGMCGFPGECPEQEIIEEEANDTDE